MFTLCFDLAQAIDVIGETKTDPCGNIRRINVEIPSLSVSDMKRLKATDRVSIYTGTVNLHTALGCMYSLAALVNGLSKELPLAEGGLSDVQ